jgi:hypothetical protein
LYGLLIIALHAGYLAFQYGWVKPAVEAWIADQRREHREQPLGFGPPESTPPQNDTFDTGVEIGMLGTAALFSCHGLFLVVVMLHRDLVRSFSGKGTTRSHDQEDDDILVAEEDS